MSYEGSAYPITASVDGVAKNVRQLRDPSVIEIGGNTYMFYSGNGEDNICGATVTYSWGTRAGRRLQGDSQRRRRRRHLQAGRCRPITAKQPPAGQKFNGWTGNTQYLADASQTDDDADGPGGGRHRHGELDERRRRPSTT